MVILYYQSVDIKAKATNATSTLLVNYYFYYLSFRLEPTCPPDQFMCDDGICIQKDFACDGVSDCTNGTDEAEDFCATCPFKFLCSNSRCTDTENVCNGVDNCRDNSDEDVCVGRC